MPIKNNHKIRLTIDTCPSKQTMQKIMHLFSKYMVKIYKEETLLLSELNRFELIGIESTDGLYNNHNYNDDIIKKINTNLHNLQVRKIEIIQQYIVVELDKNERIYLLNTNISFINFPDDNERDFMTNLVYMWIIL